MATVTQTGRAILVPLVLGVFASAASAHVPVNPGQSVEIAQPQEIACLSQRSTGDVDKNRCITDPANNRLQLVTFKAGINTGTNTAVGRFEYDFFVPDDSHSNVHTVAAQISTLISWDGLLGSLGPGGTSSGFEITIRLRDLSTNNVVQEQTMFSDTLGSPSVSLLDIPRILAAINQATAGNIAPLLQFGAARQLHDQKTATISVATLVRGTDYRLELEPKCTSGVISTAGATMCTFATDEKPSFNGGGITVGSALVTVPSIPEPQDPTALLNDLKSKVHALELRIQAIQNTLGGMQDLILKKLRELQAGQDQIEKALKEEEVEREHRKHQR